MDRKEAFSYVRSVIEQNVMIDLTDVDEKTALQDLGICSLDRLVVVMNIEKEKRILFPNELLYEAKTVGEIVDFVASAVK